MDEERSKREKVMERESIAMSARARRALDFVARVLRERGTAGRPIWPIVPSSLYHAFTEDRLRDLPVLVISYEARVCGWGAIIRPLRVMPWRAASVRRMAYWAQTFC